MFNIHLRIPSLVFQRIPNIIAIVRHADGEVTLGLASIIYQGIITDRIRQISPANVTSNWTIAEGEVTRVWSRLLRDHGSEKVPLREGKR